LSYIACLRYPYIRVYRLYDNVLYAWQLHFVMQELWCVISESKAWTYC